MKVDIKNKDGNQHTTEDEFLVIKTLRNINLPKV